MRMGQNLYMIYHIWMGWWTSICHPSYLGVKTVERWLSKNPDSWFTTHLCICLNHEIHKLCGKIAVELVLQPSTSDFFTIFIFRWHQKAVSPCFNMKNPHLLSSGEKPSSLDTTAPPAPLMVWWKIVSLLENHRCDEVELLVRIIKE